MSSSTTTPSRHAPVTGNDYRPWCRAFRLVKPHVEKDTFLNTVDLHGLAFRGRHGGNREVEAFDLRATALRYNMVIADLCTSCFEVLDLQGLPFFKFAW